MAGFWLFTAHTATYANQNLFQLSPLSLPLAFLLPQVGRGSGPGPRTVRLAIAVALLALTGLVWKVLPFVQQVNGEMIALALPIQLAIAVAAWRAAQRAAGLPAPGPQSSPG